MSRTNLDLLLQVTAPFGERTSISVPRTDGPGFDDHLSQASTETLGTLGRASEPPYGRNSPSHEYDSSSTRDSQNETSPATESAAGDRNHRDHDESHDVVESGEVHATTASGLSAAGSSEAGDRDTDSDHDEVHSDEAVVAVAETVSDGAAVVVSAKLGGSVAGDAAESANTDLAEDVAITPNSAGEAKSSDVLKESVVNDALLGNATAEAAKAPTARGERVDETAKPNVTEKLRPATQKPTVENGEPNTSDEQLAQVDRLELNGDAAALHDAAKTEIEVANADPGLNESAQSERDGGESRDANAGSSARQRSDAAAVANKIPTAAAAVGAAMQPESSVSREANDGVSRAGKSAAAKVDSVGDGANRLHAHSGAAKRGVKSSGAGEMPRVDPARFVGRVAKAFHTAQERGGTLQIRLSPPELGAMRLELTVKDGVMTAALETETTSARRVLLENLPALRDRLAEQNIRVERFDVEVRREGAGGQADPRATQDQQQSQHGQTDQRRRPPARPPIAETTRQARPSFPPRTNSTGINLVA